MQAAIIDGVRQAICDDPEWFETSILMFERAQEGEFSIDGIDYRDLFLQQFHRTIDPTVAGYLLGQIHAFLASGRASAVRIQVGQTPFRDAEIAKNAAALSSLPAPWEATFTGGKADHDGLLSWNPDAENAPRHPAWQFEMSEDDDRWPSVPLEVGYTDIETLMWHTIQCHGFARWPYGVDEIVAIRFAF